MDLVGEILKRRKARERRSLIKAVESSEGIALISEIKRKSPSGGEMRELDAAETAVKMEAAGADAISVLTEAEFFGGSLDDLKAASAAVKIPVLRKDFITERLELYEAAAYGADAVLLMAGLLESKTAGMVWEAHRIGLECLVEVHERGELEYALGSGAKLIGVNNRDLSTLKVDLNAMEKIAPLIPEDRIIVSESGINTPEDVERVKKAGADAVLVGSSIIRAGDMIKKVRELKNAC